MAEKIQEAMGRTEAGIGGGHPVAVSVSIGIAGLSPPDTIDRFISRVDAALYASKQAGRNRITVSDHA
jgi:PleD family two-component response regulator